MALRLYLNKGRDEKLVCCINSHQHLKTLTAFMDRTSIKFQPSLCLDDHRQSLTFRQKIVDLEFHIHSILSIYYAISGCYITCNSQEMCAHRVQNK